MHQFFFWSSLCVTLQGFAARSNTGKALIGSTRCSQAGGHGSKKWLWIHNGGQCCWPESLLSEDKSCHSLVYFLLISSSYYAVFLIYFGKVVLTVSWTWAKRPNVKTKAHCYHWVLIWSNTKTIINSIQMVHTLYLHASSLCSSAHVLCLNLHHSGWLRRAAGVSGARQTVVPGGDRELGGGLREAETSRCLHTGGEVRWLDPSAE